MTPGSTSRRASLCMAVCLGVALLGLTVPARGQPPAMLPAAAAPPAGPAELPAPLPAADTQAAAPAAAVPPTLTAEQAVQEALRHNPLLMTVRQQHGIAAAAVVVARTYPFNPVYQMFVLGDNGPTSAGVTNKVFNEHVFRLDLELRGQGKYRRAAAAAALTRADWDVATQELAVAVAAARAFNGVVYQRRKLEVLEETVRLNERTAELVGQLVPAGRLRPADLLLARTEVQAARAGLGAGRTNLAVAWSALRRSLGTLDESFSVLGTLGWQAAELHLEALQQAAVQQRPDIQSRRAAVDEAEARYRLEVANRYGNPSVGPAMEYNETRATFVGVWLVTPLPVLNTRRGEIQARDAERARARAELNQFEIQAYQEVQAALARLANARAWADGYQKELLPSLENSRRDLEKLLAQGDPGVDVLKVIDVQRKYLRAQDASLDALFEVSQASADLAAAVGDPSLVVPCSTPPPPLVAPPTP